jgi:hypothetical protein
MSSGSVGWSVLSGRRARGRRWPRSAIPPTAAAMVVAIRRRDVSPCPGRSETRAAPVDRRDFRHQRAHQCAAPGDRDALPRLVFACSQVVEDAIAQQVRVLPFDRRQGGGNDELGGAVDVVGEGVVGARLVGPIGGELVVGPSAQQDCVGGRLPLLDQSGHLVAEVRLDRLLRHIHDAVQRDEQLGDDAPHCGDRFGVTSSCVGHHAAVDSEHLTGDKAVGHQVDVGRGDLLNRGESTQRHVVDEVASCRRER